MRAMLLLTISVFTYDKMTLILDKGREITIDPDKDVGVVTVQSMDESTGELNQRPYYFYVSKNEYCLVC